MLGSAWCPRVWCSAGVAGGRSAAAGESQRENIGIAAVAVLVYYQHCFLLVTVGARQTLAPAVTKWLALLELAHGVMSSLVPCRRDSVVSLANKMAEYPTVLQSI